VRRWVYAGLGLCLVGIGVVGLLLPLLPSTIFFILAAAAFARSSPRLERWLLKQDRIGPAIRAWRANGAIPRRGKVAALAGMASGFAVFFVAVRPGWTSALLVAGLLIACAIFVATRPSGPA